LETCCLPHCKQTVEMELQIFIIGGSLDSPEICDVVSPSLISFLLNLYLKDFFGGVMRNLGKFHG